MKKNILINSLLTILVLLGAALVMATITSVTLDSPADNAVDSDGTVVFQCTATPDTGNVTNVMRFMANFTGGLTQNATQTLSNGTNTSVFTIGGISDGRYTWSCAANSDENATFTNASSTNTIIVDANPAGSVGPLSFDGTFAGSAVKGGRTFDYSKPVTINGCEGSNDGGGNATLLINQPRLSGFKFLKNLSANTNETSGFVFRDTSEVGKYTANCTFYGLGGGTNASVLTFDVIPFTIRKGGAAAIPGFKFPKGKTIVGADTTDNGGDLVAESSWLFREGGRVTLSINGESHSFQVTKIGLGEVTIRVSSEAFDVTVKVEETKQVDVNGDGDADVAITLNQITEKGYADLTFAVTKGQADVGPEGEVGTEPTTPAGTPTQAAGQGMWLVVAIIVIVLVIGYFLVRKR